MILVKYLTILIYVFGSCIKKFHLEKKNDQRDHHQLNVDNHYA